MRTYQVKKGESLLSIAKKHNVSVVKLKEINHLKKNDIQAGKTLKIPIEQLNSSSGSSQPDDKEKQLVVKKNTVKTNHEKKSLTSDEVAQLGTNKHIVTKGESLFSIARRYRVDAAKIKEWNDIAGDETISPGQILIVKK